MFALGLQSPQCWCLRLRSSSHDLITEWMGAEQCVETVTVSDRDGVKVEQHLDSVCLVTQLLLVSPFSGCRTHGHSSSFKDAAEVWLSHIWSAGPDMLVGG